MVSIWYNYSFLEVKMKIIIILSLLFSSVMFAKIYKYKDRYGRIHYVDDISKVPNNRVNHVKTLNSRFFKTDYKVIDKYRKIILKKGVYYKELKAQKDALIYWGSLMVNAGFTEFKVDLARIKSIRVIRKNGKKLGRKQRRKKAVLLANFFKLFENSWPRVYEEINFKSSGNKSIDTMRKHKRSVKTNSDNISMRVKLLEEWAAIIKNNKNADSKLITDRLNTISAMYDVPKPNIKALSKYIDETIKVFEKEFRKE